MQNNATQYDTMQHACNANANSHANAHANANPNSHANAHAMQCKCNAMHCNATHCNAMRYVTHNVSCEK
eukprot:4966628-Lingulodinium_polyedra.AAC.1